MLVRRKRGFQNLQIKIKCNAGEEKERNRSRHFSEFTGAYVSEATHCAWALVAEQASCGAETSVRLDFI